MLKFGENYVGKCKFHDSKEPIDINDANFEQILISTNILLRKIVSRYFFLSEYFLTDIDDSQDSRRKGWDCLSFYSTTSTRLWTFRHLFATFHTRWLYHIFIRTVFHLLVFSRLILNEIYHLIKLPFD